MPSIAAEYGGLHPPYRQGAASIVTDHRTAGETRHAHPRHGAYNNQSIGNQDSTRTAARRSNPVPGSW